ncbi:hypothetical protein SBA4_1210035 [Candidatus Sulfopaludibacter sp. SbA4]|nr:hypothetical protein SBA4_1210035 [Candidatus Sulfopaludibacter sp. SbA4]
MYYNTLKSSQPAPDPLVRLGPLGGAPWSAFGCGYAALWGSQSWLGVPSGGGFSRRSAPRDVSATRDVPEGLVRRTCQQSQSRFPPVRTHCDILLRARVAPTTSFVEPIRQATPGGAGLEGTSRRASDRPWSNDEARSKSEGDSGMRRS